MTLFDLLDASRRAAPAALAVNDLTYEALHASYMRVLGRLRERGVGVGDRVALYCENRIGWVVGYLAALRLGAIVVPANVMYRAADLEHVLRNAGVTIVIASETTKAHVKNLAGSYEIIDVADLEGWAADKSLAPGVPARDVETDDVAAIIYTSGTTGRSKGAMITFGNLAAICANIITAWRWTERDVLLIALPLFHVHGLCAALNSSLASGGRIIIHERFDVDATLAEIKDSHVTMFFGVPTMYVRLLERRLNDPPPRLRLWVSGSAPLSADLFEEFRERFGAEILERYGATEFGLALTNRYSGPRISGSVGVPFPAMRVRVATPGTADPVPRDEVGEVLVAGTSVFKGYWENPAATEEAFVLDDEGTRWYRSGDLGMYDSKQRVYRIVGRLKELIITGGFNVYPREIEIEIDQFVAVRASAVIGRPDRARGELPVAFIEAESGFDPEALLVHLRTRVASFKVPKEIIVVEALPRNALGKIEKHRLRERLS
ncbi:MAG TPA: AMP-binding protein [Candidatus Binatus sp.]|nr:AMP-binding protein [Candidatus Binatus sp.]